MSKQKAVDWLIEWMMQNQYFIGDDLLDAVKQAKQIEKEQIMESFLDGVYEGSPTDEDYENCKVSGEQYYNKIYNQ